MAGILRQVLDRRFTCLLVISPRAGSGRSASAPHCHGPCRHRIARSPQPYLVPVSLRCSRITHRSGVSGSAATSAARAINREKVVTRWSPSSGSWLSGLVMIASRQRARSRGGGPPTCLGLKHDAATLRAKYSPGNSNVYGSPLHDDPTDRGATTHGLCRKMSDFSSRSHGVYPRISAGGVWLFAWHFLRH